MLDNYYNTIKMLSDSLFEAQKEIIKAVRDYDYSDDNRQAIIYIIKDMNEIINKYTYITEDDPLMLKNRPVESLKIAVEWFDRAVELRDTDSEDFFVDRR